MVRQPSSKFVTKFGSFLSKARPMVTGRNRVSVTNRNLCPLLTGDRILREPFEKKERHQLAPFPIFQDIVNNKAALKEKLFPKGIGIIERRQFKGISIDQTENEVIVEMELGDWKADDIQVRMEGSWLVMEGSKTVKDHDEGGLIVRHVLRRYEFPQVSGSGMTVNRAEKTIKITLPLVKS